MRRYLLITFLMLISAARLDAQVTSGSLTGTVKDDDGEPLIGATIKATHQPTGTAYGSTTNTEGRYTIPNMRVGGPYVVTISYLGFATETKNNISIQLGEPYLLNQVLRTGEVGLKEVVVVGTRDNIFNSRRTGASTSVSREQIEELPTLNRSLSDYWRLTPQSNGNSFGGQNSRFNNITIDGAVNNDVFAASSTAITPGSGSNTQPISLDAIQEIQVVLAPYDVSYGNFTGAGVNAVTRSGTNKFEGSAYFYTRSEKTVGKQPNGLKANEFTNGQYGFRLGGPVVKDKLFFFVNGELGRIESPSVLNAGDPGALLTVAQAQDIATSVQTKYGYDVGGFGVIPTKTQSDKVFGRLDWNINSKNQLMLRHNYIKAFDDAFTRTANNFRFGNNGGRNNNTQHISVLELRSSISKSLSNNLIIGYSTVRDARSTFGGLFPHVQINNINGSSSNQLNFGSERSSTSNQLDQDILELTDNFKVFLGNHTLTFGTHNEFFKFRNLFVNNRYGYWQFNSLEDFNNNKPLTAESTTPITSNPGEANFSAAQLGFYWQDEMLATPNLKLTIGFRVDIPVFNQTPERNPLAETAFGYKTNITPKSSPIPSPRFGFNYDVFGNKKLQLRGGTGLFTGRVPFVWLSNQFTNNGVLFATVNQRNPGPATFEPDPQKQSTVGGPVSTYELNLVGENFLLPQTFRSNFAADFKLPGGIVTTLEAIYNKTMNGISYSDINIKGRTGTLNPALSGGNDLRPTYGGKVSSTVTNAILLTNTSRGSSYTYTAQLQKAFNFGLNTSIAYTYGEARDINGGTSSTARSNWQFNQIVLDANNPQLDYSRWDLRHRIVGSLNYGVQYGKNKLFGTTFSMFYAGRSGEPVSYVYNGDLNGDGANQNDLIYVPRTASEIKLVPLSASGSNPALTTAQQWDELNSFIENDPYLRGRRGQYVERFGARMPWQHAFDVRLLQDLGGLVKGTTNRIQLSVDVFNVGNLINKEWGRGYSLGNNASTLINYSTSGGGGFTFRSPNGGTAYQVSQTSSRWEAQFGVRYIFN
ncbi:carboxypeptidase regulatory-like domain-containing protein [Paradesertivirga mongoliensis]|uniref:Carboxypeptidase regulatory-like domain-containing protein n=1 Tax=Paradesertivirga mongoliensis TaxID=2100740 RepID=A0ABW4ZM59_9SPHI|nr:TonB-dependent receptor [Pedobacter mongoliensis]